jgi:hypothetical protein
LQIWGSLKSVMVTQRKVGKLVICISKVVMFNVAAIDLIVCLLCANDYILLRNSNFNDVFAQLFFESLSY